MKINPPISCYKNIGQIMPDQKWSIYKTSEIQFRNRMHKMREAKAKIRQA